MELTKEWALRGLECCAEFLCEECPYQKYHSSEYILRCTHKLILDLRELLEMDTAANTLNKQNTEIETLKKKIKELEVIEAAYLKGETI